MNRLTRYDSIFHLGLMDQVDEFFTAQASDTTDSLKPDRDCVLQMTFQLDPNVKHYTRAVYDILSFTKDCGGLLAGLAFFCYSIV